MIAHISQPTENELIDRAKRKETHLGYWGTVDLINGCKPELAIIGEFWAGFDDLRIDLIGALRKRCEGVPILPASESLVVDLKTRKVQCTHCEEFAPHDEIEITLGERKYGPLSYLCPSCHLSPSHRATGASR